MKPGETFHLGLCMAGSVTAGAYTAGVMDYLIEALEAWEQMKLNDDIPSHQVVIDLLCGSSGGGMTGAISLFALFDKMDHAKLDVDQVTYAVPKNNILWDTWVELNGGDILERILSTSDINPQRVTSLLNSSFINEVAANLQKYIDNLPKNAMPPPFFGRAPEMFMTLFNVTGINYELHTRSLTENSKGIQYVSDHRDIAHFRWSNEAYPDESMSIVPEGELVHQCDGRIPVSIKNNAYVPLMIDAAKATGAFPVGLEARLLRRPAKFLWDNPFFNRDGRFNPQTIRLGDEISSRDSMYVSLNSDGGTANNEPVEIARNILLNMRNKIYQDVEAGDKDIEKTFETEKAIAVKDKLKNTSILLIDPFPSLINQIHPPDVNSGKFPSYSWKLIKAMNSQLIFDAKDALDAYKKENYGLHVISPSKENSEPKHAIACGSIGGFGGFLEREFRVHDFFLGRKNCQSFLRKYFVARVDETDPENRACVKSVLDAYDKKPLAKERFSFEDEHGIKWLPIIPDVSLVKPIKFRHIEGKGEYTETNKLSVFKLKKMDARFLERYHPAIAQRFMSIFNNLIGGNWLQRLVIKIFTHVKKDSVTKRIVKEIMEDLTERKLM